MNDVSEASRVPSGHGFPVTIKERERNHYVREWQSGACHRFQNVTLICRIGRLPDPVSILRSVIFLPLSFCLLLPARLKR